MTDDERDHSLAPDVDGFVTLPPDAVGIEGAPEAFEQSHLFDDAPTHTLRSEDGKSEIRLYRLPNGNDGSSFTDDQQVSDTGLRVIAPGTRIDTRTSSDSAIKDRPEYARVVDVQRPTAPRELPELREVILSYYRQNPAVVTEQWRAVDTALDPELTLLPDTPHDLWLRITSGAFGDAIKGTSYWVSWEMAEVASRAEAALLGCGFAAHDLPSPAGWAYLDGTRTLTIGEGEGHDPWATLDGVRVLLAWRERPPTDPIYPRGAAYFAVHIDRASHVNLMAWFGRYADPDQLQEALDTLPPFVLLGHGYAHFTEVDEVFMIGPSAPHAGEWFYLFRGICALLQQPLVTTASEYAPRAVQRRYRRLDSRSQAADPIRVIRLRTPSASSGSESGITYQHQWIVRGHWRRQACGPDRAERRPIWIAPHRKGPENAPLLGGEKVYAWVR